MDESWRILFASLFYRLPTTAVFFLTLSLIISKNCLLSTEVELIRVISPASSAAMLLFSESAAIIIIYSRQSISCYSYNVPASFNSCSASFNPCFSRSSRNCLLFSLARKYNSFAESRRSSKCSTWIWDYWLSLRYCSARSAHKVSKSMGMRRSIKQLGMTTTLQNEKWCLNVCEYQGVRW